MHTMHSASNYLWSYSAPSMKIQEFSEMFKFQCINKQCCMVGFHLHSANQQIGISHHTVRSMVPPISKM